MYIKCIRTCYFTLKLLCKESEKMKKSALLIGINKYDVKSQQLKAAVKDANDMEAKLSKLGFSCCCYTDIDSAHLNRIKTDFERELLTNDVGLFYFAGHGFEIDSVNYLAMTDAPLLDDEIAIKHCCLKLNDIISMLENSDLKVKIVILDACRTTTTTGSRGSTMRGFAPIFAPKGTIIAFSTSPGQVAKEKKSGNGVYTSALLDCIDYPGLTIENMFKRVREIVSTSTRGKQISWEHTSLLGDFSFNPGIIDGSFIDFYSNDALADELYMTDYNSVLASVIDDLKTQDYNYQNPAINKINHILQMNYNQLISEDLFVLGRNIYQTACGKSFAGQIYLENLENNLGIMEEEVAFHILNGMAYEIYFNNRGKLRKSFKSEKAGVIIRLLETQYEKSLKFIVSQLQPFDDQVFYLPGSNQKFIINISLDQHKESWNGLDSYIVKQVYCRGIPILHDNDSDEIWNSKGTPYLTYYTKKDVENKILNSMVVSSNRVRFIYSDAPDSFNNSEDSNFVFPISFTLYWHN